MIPYLTVTALPIVAVPYLPAAAVQRLVLLILTTTMRVAVAARFTLAAAARVLPLTIPALIATAPVTAAAFMRTTKHASLSLIPVSTETALQAVAARLQFAVTLPAYFVAILSQITAPLDTPVVLWPIAMGMFILSIQLFAATAGNMAAVYSPKVAHARLFMTATFSAIAQLLAAAQFTLPAAALSFAARFAYAGIAEPVPGFI